MMETVKVMINEIIKGCLISWNYKFEMLLGLVMMGGVFIGIGYFIGRGHLEPDQLSFLLIGYIIWLFSTTVISNLSNELLAEAQAGTLEQIFMSPVNVMVILFARSLSALIIAGISILLFAVATIWGLGTNIPLHFQSLIVFAITIAGLFGFGFIIAGATLVFKRVGALANLVVNALLFLNGSMFPVDQFPGWLAMLSRTLPTTQGIELLRKIILDAQSLSDLWQDGSLLLLSYHSVLYVSVGLIFFVWSTRRAKTCGTLGHY